MNKYLKRVVPLVDAIAETFGKNCEVVLHDFRYPERSIVKIANGHVTGRSVGGPITDLALRFLDGRKGSKNIDKIVGYRTQTPKGMELKSTTVFIRDDKGEAVGCLCINIDVAPYQSARNFIDEICRISPYQENGEMGEVTEKFDSNVDDLVGESFRQAMSMVGKPLAYINKKDKLHIVRELKDKRLFLIKGTAKRVSKELGVSLPTIYKYLEEI